MCTVLPSMNTHPDNITMLTGQSVNLTCSATGTDVVYQWMRNGVIISDDNSNVLRINEIKHNQMMVYINVLLATKVEMLHLIQP